MSESLDRVVRLIARIGGVDEFVATERVVDRAEITGPVAAPTTRRGTTGTIDVVLFRDLPRGRGSARLRLATTSANPERLIADTARRARAVLGPAWRLPPPSAPARVDLVDPGLDRDLTRAVEGLRRTIAASQPASPDLESAMTQLAVTAERARTTVRTSRGFAHAYDETRVAADVTIASRAGAVERLVLRGRRTADLAVADALARADRRTRHRLAAVPLPAGRYDLVLTERALIPDSPRAAPLAGRDLEHRRTHPVDYGWFAPLVAQADSRAARHGLGRYRIGQSIYGPRDATGDPLTVVSDGTVPFGLLSQPIGELGEPVRRFALVERGRAAAYALDLHEAALRGQTGNGGVRNLVVTAGTATPEALRQPTTRAIVEAVDLAWLDIDPRTGAFTAALDLSLAHRTGQPPTSHRGGLVRGNLFDCLARARLSARTATTAWYTGPDAIRIDDIAVT